MDTSETYIKMNVGLWEDWGYSIGDYVVFRDVGRYDKPVKVHLIRHVNNAGVIFLVGGHEFASYTKDQLYPLPRQDQLQEMYYTEAISERYQTSRERHLVLMMERFTGSDHAVYTTNPYADQFTSMEQLWLAFVMKEKYNKVWTSEEWCSYQRKEM